jgi:hypothetical protein
VKKLNKITVLWNWLVNGFGPTSKGIVAKLYGTFVRAVGSIKTAEFLDLPWTLVRNVAISLNNESKSPKAAAVVINGLVAYLHAQRPSEEIIELLEHDQRASRKNIIQADFDKSVSGGQLASAASLLDELLAIEKDPDELAALQNVRAVIAQRRQSRRIKGAFWIAGAAVGLILIITNNDNRPAPTATYTPAYAPTSSPRPSPDRSQYSDVSEERPQVGTELRLCEYWKLVRTIERAIEVTPENSRERIASQARYEQNMSLQTFDGMEFEVNLPASAINGDEFQEHANSVVERTLEPAVISNMRVLLMGKVFLAPKE